MFRRREGDEEDLDRELQSDLYAESEEQRKKGLSDAEARNAAQRALGNVSAIKEDTRQAWGWMRMDQFFQDVRYGIRTLRKKPLFAAVAILTLALGIGANIGIFSLMDAVLFRPLPVEKPGELMKFESYYSYPMYRELRDGNSVFSGLIARQVTPVDLMSGNQPERGTAELVSGNYFSVLGIQPMLGRWITPADDDTPMHHPVAVLSYAFWRDRFSRDASMIGRTIRINAFPFTIIGVAPASFTGVQAGTAPSVWTPLMSQPQLMAEGVANTNVLDNTGDAWLELMGRRAAGVSEQEAIAGINVVFHQTIRDGHHKLYDPKKMFPGRESLHLHAGAAGFSRLAEVYGNPLYLLMGVVAIVLLIACVNIANLLLARGAARRREIAVRLALGAGRSRLMRQLLAESMLLALAGGALGIAFSSWSVALLLRFLPSNMVVGNRMIALSVDVRMDARVLGFALGVSILTGILFGLVPAMQATHPDVAGTLKDEGASMAAGPRRADPAKLLVISQVTLSFLLVIGAGLFLRSLHNVTNTDTGMQTENVVQVSMDPSMNGYPYSQTVNFYRQLLPRLKALPGAQSVAMAAYPFLSGAANGAGLIVPGRPAPADYRDNGIEVNFIGGDFFQATGTRLLRGRDFLPSDSSRPVPAIILTQAAANHFFPGEECIGKKARFGGKDGVEIIGVAADVKYDSVREDIPRVAYVGFDESPWPVEERTIYARTSGDTAAVIQAIRREIQSLDSSLPIYNVKTFAQQKEESLAPERMMATLSSFFGGLALLLASIGLYGVMASKVQRRTREIGIRMSLGATRGGVLWMVLKGCLWLAGAGVATGILLSLYLSKFLSSLLYGVPPRDPVSIAGAAITFLGVAALAGFLPAWRASRVDPMIALRYE